MYMYVAGWNASDGVLFIDLAGVAISQSGREAGTKETWSRVKYEHRKRDPLESYVKERTMRKASILERTWGQNTI